MATIQNIMDILQRLETLVISIDERQRESEIKIKELQQQIALLVQTQNVVASPNYEELDPHIHESWHIERPSTWPRRAESPLILDEQKAYEEATDDTDDSSW